jgi:hypothetical protein
MIHMGYATEFVRLCNAEWDVDNPAPQLLQQKPHEPQLLRRKLSLLPS